MFMSTQAHIITMCVMITCAGNECERVDFHLVKEELT